MTSQAVSTDSDITCTLSYSSAPSDNEHSHHTRLEHNAVAFGKEFEDCFKMEKERNTTTMVIQLEETVGTDQESVELLLPSALSTPRKSTPNIPLMWLPASSFTTPPSSPLPEHIWDSPQTPLQLLKHADTDLSTPLTPPTTMGRTEASFSSEKPTLATPSRVRSDHPTISAAIAVADEKKVELTVTTSQQNSGPFVFGSSVSPKEITLVPREADIKPEDDSKEIRPPKLPTIQLRFECPVLPSPPPMTFNAVPFVGTWSLDGAKEQKTHRATSHIEKNEQFGAAIAKTTPKKAQQKAEKLRTVLEHILPFDLHTRLIKKPMKCVATLVNVKIPCESARNSSQSVVMASLAEIRSCIDSSNYFTLPQHIERLVANVTCSLHQGVALSEGVIKPRMKTLRDLIVDLPQQPEEIFGVFSKWLQALYNDTTSASVLYSPSGLALHTAWTASLSMLLDHTTPTNIQERVNKDITRCVVFDCNESLPMDSNHPQERRSVIDKKIKLISQSVQKEAFLDLPGHFAGLVQQVMCRSHIVLANSNKKMLRAIVLSLTSTPSWCRPVVGNWIREITKCDILPPLATIGATGFEFGKTVAFPTSQFEPYEANHSSSLAITKALESKIRQPLSTVDLEEGFIYMFWDKQNFGMIKIGRTRDLKERLKEWNRKCKVTHYYHQSGEPRKVLHVQRIERLMQIELVNYRKKRTCGGCGTMHIEWFDLHEEKARQVYRKWQDWIEQQPYAKDGTGEWKIRPEMLESVSEVCKPVEFLSTEVKKGRPRQSLPKGRTNRRASRKSL